MRDNEIIPAEETQLSILFIMQIIREVGIPAAVINAATEHGAIKEMHFLRVQSWRDFPLPVHQRSFVPS
jgi:hypothetical protein